MIAKCSYCPEVFELSEPDFLTLFKNKRKVYCTKCANKKTIGCYECKNFVPHHWLGDVCKTFKHDEGIPIYCNKFEEYNRKDERGENEDRL